MSEIFTSPWFWYIAIAYTGAGFGKYLASKEPDYGFIGLFAWLVSIAVYVFIILLFWKLDRWYYPIIVFVSAFAIDMIVTEIHAIACKGEPGGEMKVFGVLGTAAGIILTILAYINLL